MSMPPERDPDMGGDYREYPQPKPLPPTCSHCGFPLIGSSSSFRHYGTHTAHQENECLRLLIADRDALRKFAQAVMQSWPDGDVDGGELQDAALSAGLLVGVEVSESCGDECQCVDAGEWPTTCYRRTPLLTGDQKETKS